MLSSETSIAALLGRYKWPGIVLLFVVIAIVSVIMAFKQTSSAPTPLYWVAPMDPNYRRDGPGKSPMGMDLVPVYEEEPQSSSLGTGAINLSDTLQQQLGVRLSTVTVGTLSPTVRAFGSTRYKNTLTYRLYPKISATLEVLFIDAVGERVRQGQPLFGLYSSDLVRAQEAFLKAPAGNSKELAAMTLREMGLSERALNTLIRDGAAQQSVVFYAPTDGVVTELKALEGAQIPSGQTLLTVQDDSSLWAELEVYANDASQVRIGQKVTLKSSSHPQQIWHAKIEEMDGALDANRRTLKVRAPLENSGVAMFANIPLEGIIQLTKRASQKLIPSQAVIRLGLEDRVVIANQSGDFKSIRVNLGYDDGEQVEILEGLQEGDQVVTSAQFLIDSESSKLSDFQRIEAPPVETTRETWITALVQSVDPQQRITSLSHDPVEEWGMPGMTMNFKIAASVNVDQIKPNSRIRAYIVDRPDEPLFVITQLETKDQ